MLPVKQDLSISTKGMDFTMRNDFCHTERNGFWQKECPLLIGTGFHQ